MKLEFVKEALGKQHHLLVGEGYCRFRIALEKTLYFHPWQVSLTEFKLNKSECRNDLRSRWGGQTV